MKDKKFIYIYYLMAVVMMFFPVLNMFTFIPLVMIYKNFDYKRYLVSGVVISLFSFLFFTSFSSIVPFLISFTIINGMSKNKRGYEILFVASVFMAFIIIGDFLIIKLNTENYAKFLEILKSSFSNMEIYGQYIDISNFEKTMEQVANYYPAIAFFTSYFFCSLGYCILYKIVYRLKNDKENIVTPISYKFIAVFVFVAVLINLLSGSINVSVHYKLYLAYVNVLIVLFTMISIQGFIAFNLFLKSRIKGFIPNVISIISLFIVFSYFIYFIYGTYNSVIRGVKNEKSIS